MKIPSLLVALLVSTSTTVDAESTCSEESGVCLCSGSCPSFTSGWDKPITGLGICIATKSSGSVSMGGLPMSDGEVVMVNDIKYTYPFDACPGGGGDAVSTGDVDVTQTQSDGDTTTDDDKGDNLIEDNDNVIEDDDNTTTDDNNSGTTSNYSGTTIINGVKGKMQFTTDTCKYGTDVQCAVASGPLCKNNLCASTTSTCDDATGGCLSLMGKAEACNKPANICGDGYCGTPPTYSNCQCKDNKCYAMKFVPDNGSAPIMGDVPGGIKGVISIGNSGAIMVGSWLVGGAAFIAAFVGL